MRVDSGHRPVSHCVSVLISGDWRGGAFCAEAPGTCLKGGVRVSPGGSAPGSALRSPWSALRSGRILPVLRRVWTVTEDNHRALRGFRVPGASDLIEHTSWGEVCARVSVM